MRGYKNIFLCLVIISFFLFMPAAQSTGQFFVMENPLVGQPAPDFTLNTTEGKPLNLTKYRDGKSAIIFFWATWCPHCFDQMQELKAKKREFEEKNISLVLIDLGEDGTAVKAYLKKNEIPYNVFLDEKNTTFDSYQLIGVPTFVFIDASGTVQAVEHFLPPNYAELLVARVPEKT